VEKLGQKLGEPSYLRARSNYGRHSSADIEAEERRVALETQRLSSGTIYCHHPETAVYLPSTGLAAPDSVQSYDLGAFQFNLPLINYGLATPTNSSMSRDQSHSRAVSIPNTTINVFGSWSWDEPNANNPSDCNNVNGLGSSTLPIDNQPSHLPWPVISSTSDVSSYWTANGSSSCLTPSQNAVSSVVSIDHSISPRTMGSMISGLASQSSNANQAHLHRNTIASPHNTSDKAFKSLSERLRPSARADDPAFAEKAIGDILSQAAAFETDVLDEKDISQSARDYMLDLYFCPPESSVGTDENTDVLFRTRIAGPPEHQPLPGLLFAMYTIGATSSFIPAVRTLADSLFLISKMKLEVAIEVEDRLIDVINGTRILSEWLFGRGRVVEGYQMSARAMSLCQACGLHTIKSSRFIRDGPVAGEAEENWSLLGPPRDERDLSERIRTL
jgi:hypothetical protein